MKDKYLEITYRKGKLLAAYLYLPRESGEKSQRTEKLTEGVLVDYGKYNQPIGIEIIEPRKVNFDQINKILSKVEDFVVVEEDFAPLLFAYE